MATTINDVLKGFVLPEPADKSIKLIKSVQKKIAILETPVDFFFEAEVTRQPMAEVLLKFKKQLNRLEMARLGIPEIDYGFLSLHDNSGLPAFILVPINSDHFYLPQGLWMTIGMIFPGKPVKIKSSMQVGVLV